MRAWNLTELQTPGGSRSPVVLHSEEGAARAVLIALEAGQELGDHQVKENAFLLVVEGDVRIESGGESMDGGAGSLVHFLPDERHSVSTATGARLLLVLAPWPGEGHYRGEAKLTNA